MTVLPDHGPIYTETDMSQFPVEPFNTISNLLFLLVALYWLRKIRSIRNKSFQNYLKFAVPVLILGYIGGTVYHATRSHFLWIYMDVFPIYVLGIVTAFYYWKLIGVGFLKTMLIAALVTGLPVYYMWVVVEPFDQLQTLTYFFVFLPVILPAIIDQIQLKGRLFVDFALPMGFVFLALGFRAFDSHPWVQVNFSVGTHWLWHSFGAFTVFLVTRFLYIRSEFSLDVTSR